MKNEHVHIFLSLLLIIICVFEELSPIIQGQSASKVNTDENTTPYPECLHFYFDFGTNVGIQIRKVFEPDLYPGSGILPYFDLYFGEPFYRRLPGTVCAIGVEPNVAHEERLKKLETSYNKQEWFTLIYTKSGVGTSSGWMLQAQTMLLSAAS
jgi:hypothetical protein